MKSRCIHILLFGLLMLLCGYAWAAEKDKEDSPPRVKAATIALGAWRGSQIMGINVYSKEGKRVGAIADIVGDVNGRVLYVILSQGGFLGIGDKMIPLPRWTIRPGAKPKTVQVQPSAESLKGAPSFDGHNWPDFTTSEWREKTNKYYQAFRETDGAKSK